MKNKKELIFKPSFNTFVGFIIGILFIIEIIFLKRIESYYILFLSIGIVLLWKVLVKGNYYIIKMFWMKFVIDCLIVFMIGIGFILWYNGYKELNFFQILLHSHGIGWILLYYKFKKKYYEGE